LQGLDYVKHFEKIPKFQVFPRGGGVKTKKVWRARASFPVHFLNQIFCKVSPSILFTWNFGIFIIFIEYYYYYY
jgi:hypothetical protein